MAVELSVVIPVLNEEENLPELYRRLTAVVPGSVGSYEIVFVDDGSTDTSWALIANLAASDSHVRGVSFSRNFGHQMAFSAGLDHAAGEAVVIMDADLQDSPELIPALVARWREGYDVVYAVRAKRAGETIFKKVTAAGFYRLLHRITRIKIPIDTGDFRLMGPKALAAFARMPERHRFTRGMVAWMGFRQIGVEYDRPARFAGETKYTMRRMLRLASDGIMSFSYQPLQVASWLGGAVLVASLGVLATLLGRGVLGLGWSRMLALIAAMTFLGGAQLVAVGLLGEYVGRILDESKHRPLYLVQDTVGDPVTASRR